MSININDPWNTGESDPLGDIASAIDKFKEVTGDRYPTIYITEDCPFYKEIISALDFKDAPTVVVMKGCAVGKSEYINVGTIGHVDHGKSAIQSMLRNLKEAELALIMFGESLQHVDFPFDVFPLEVLDRRYMLAPEPVLKEPNNKPWYQDRKHYRNKKSRRKL